MSSSVFFKFKSQKEPQRVTFDGTGISVFELKRDIISISGLGDGTDFDLAIYSVDTNEEYDDDTSIISRGTTVVARRLPAARPGAGRAARYVSGKMPVTAKNQHRVEATRTAPSAAAPSSNPAADKSNMTEEEKIAAMFQAGGEAWEQQQQQMANQKAIHRPGGFQKTVSVPDKPLPPGYTCHRCGEKGHWIQACPTNNDPTFDGRPKFRRTTGIPRSFLKVVEKPTALTKDGTVDVSQLPAGVMYTSTGEWVVAEPDKVAWEQFQAKAKASAEKAEAVATSDQKMREMGLECPIDKRMFVDPMKTPCCGKTYCRDCIENALLGNDFVCPGCSSDNVLVDNLITDDETVKKIKTYEEEKAQAKKEAKEKSVTPPPEKSSEKDVTSPGKQDAKNSASPKPAAAAANAAVTATNGTKSASATPQPPSADSKKRAAEDPLENTRIPTGPAAMRKQQNNMPINNAPANPMDAFVQQMNAMSQGLPPNQQAMNIMPPNMNMGFPNPMMGMPPMGMMGMNPMMMNPGWGGMGGFPMNGGMNGMMGGGGGVGNGFPNQNQQRNMYGTNPMMANGNGGYGRGQGQGQQWQQNGNMNNHQGWNHNNNNNHGYKPQQQQQQQQTPQQPPQQQQQPQMPSQAGSAQVEDDAYIRKPVNPHRHQARNKRQRSVDYREM
ncbi:hypothetical protein AAFC00_001108 [Neodothiora populina]|uniref:DWNN-domain-containing protein n=1 Tax=Neodothiora populina TaxID=2781224 RepID=A0ABR3PMS8_9PEZI